MTTDQAGEQHGFSQPITDAITRVIEGLHFDHCDDLPTLLLERIRNENAVVAALLDTNKSAPASYLDSLIAGQLRHVLDAEDDWTLVARLRIKGMDLDNPSPDDLLWLNFMAGQPLSYFGAKRFTPDHLALIHDVAVTRLDQADIALREHAEAAR